MRNVVIHVDVAEAFDVCSLPLLVLVEPEAEGAPVLTLHGEVLGRPNYDVDFAIGLEHRV